MNKLKLIDIIDKSELFYLDLYYNAIVINEGDTKFNIRAKNEILELSMYLYQLQRGIHTLSKNINIPELSSRVMSYADFKKELEKFKEIEYKDKIPTEITNLYQKVKEISLEKLLKNDDWIRVYSTNITQKEFKEFGKIYVSVDNKDLYQFARLLLIKSLQCGIYDYEFKINNSESINRCDNIVIYFTKENLNKYLNIINDIKRENQNFKINESNIFGQELSSGVAIGKDYKDGNSFSGKICKTIIELKKQRYDSINIANLVEEATDKHLVDVMSLISEEKTKENYQK